MTVTIERHTHSCQYSHDGSTWVEFGDVVEGLSTHHDVNADRGTVEIRCATYPSGLTENDEIVVYLDGELVFAGRMARPARGYYVEAGATFACEGNGALMAHNWQADALSDATLDLGILDDGFNRVYENMDDAAIIQNLAEAASVPAVKTEIESSGYTRGALQPIVLRPGQTFWSLIKGDGGLDYPVGYITYEDNRGVIVRKPFNVTPGSIDFTATEGTNIISASRSPQGTESIYNRGVVYGLEIFGLTVGGIGVGDYSEANSNIDGYNPKVLRTNVIETDADALDAATQIVLHNNFPQDKTTITVPGSPGRTIGKTWQIDSAELDHAGDNSSLRYVATLSHNYGAGVGYETTADLIRPTESW